MSAPATAAPIPETSAASASAETVEHALEGLPAGLVAQTLRIALPAQEDRLRQIMAARLRKEEKRAKRRARKLRR